MKRLFALDQNFPETIIATLAENIVLTELVPVRKIDPSFSRLDDWALILALYQHKRPWDGLITCDANMLGLPREMAILLQTQLTLVVVKGQGDNPVRATGIMLSHMDYVCRNTRPDEAQVWELGASQKPGQSPWSQMEKIGKHRGCTANDLYQSHRIDLKKLKKSADE